MNHHAARSLLTGSSILVTGFPTRPADILSTLEQALAEDVDATEEVSGIRPRPLFACHDLESMEADDLLEAC